MFYRKTKITAILERKGNLSAFPSDQLLFSVEEGEGKLRSVWYDGGRKDASPYEGYSTFALLLGDTPLVQIQANGSPTCANLLAAGYGIPEDNCELQQIRQVMVQPYAGIRDALERFHSLFALLQSGIYILTYSHLCPTDGASNFFWDVPEVFAHYEATAEYYNNGVFPAFPCFLYPTQDAQKYNSNRVEHYREMIRVGQPLPPVLTYSLESSMCVLLDGHHRACACALEGVKVPSLTITRPSRCQREGVPYLLWPDGSENSLVTLPFPNLEKHLNAPMGERQHKQYPFSDNIGHFARCWEKEYAKMASCYPNCFDAGVLGLYPEVELTTEGIRKLAMDEDYEEITAASHLLHYASRQPGADKKGLAIEFTKKGYPDKLRLAAYEVLDSVKDDFEVDDLMIEILVNCEKKDNLIFQIANGHWDKTGS